MSSRTRDAACGVADSTWAHALGPSITRAPPAEPSNSLSSASTIRVVSAVTQAQRWGETSPAQSSRAGVLLWVILALRCGFCGRVGWGLTIVRQQWLRLPHVKCQRPEAFNGSSGPCHWPCSGNCDVRTSQLTTETRNRPLPPLR